MLCLSVSVKRADCSNIALNRMGLNQIVHMDFLYKKKWVIEYHMYKLVEMGDLTSVREPMTPVGLLLEEQHLVFLLYKVLGCICCGVWDDG